MFKFLRKYSVWILGVGGTLLLIAFLAPNVIQQLAQQAGYAGTTQATVGDGETVGFEDWQQIVLESQVIDQIYDQIPGVGELESPSHWFLLTREADLAGLTPSPDAVGIDAQNLLAIASQSGVSPRVVIDAIAHLQGVQRLVQLYQTAGRFSDRRLNNAADDLFTSVAIESVIIPAKPEDNGSFSEDVINAQFEKWADTPSGEGDYGFGYQLPDRFKVEWLTIPGESIRESAKASEDFSSKEQRKFWRRNENDPRFPTIEPGAAIPSEVSEAYLDELEGNTRDQIARFANERLRSPRRGLETINGFLVLPDDWNVKKFSFEALGEALQSEYSLALPAYGASAEYQHVEDAANMEVLGDIFVTNLGDTPKRFDELVRAAKEFGGDGILGIQASVASPALETSENDLIIFRLTEASPASRAQSADEVKDAVVYDLGRIARWETLKAEADIIEADAKQNGLLAVSQSQDSIVNQTQPITRVETGVPAILDAATRRQLMSQTILSRIGTGARINEMGSNINGLALSDPSVVDAIHNAAEQLSEDILLSELPVEERTLVIQSEDNMSLVVVRLTDLTPASQELAKGLSGGDTNLLQTLLTFDELGGANEVTQVFSLDALTQRHQFKRGNNEVDTEETGS